MTEVEMPDGTILEFPDGMSREDMRAAAQRYMGSAAPSPQQQGGRAQERGLMDAIVDNVVGRDDGVESYGEQLGSMIRGGGAAVARGMADVPAIPANLAQLAAMGYEKATGAEEPSAVSRALNKLPDTRDMLASVPVIGPESQYEMPGRIGRAVSTVGEFAGGAGAAAGPSTMLRYGAIPGAVSEGAGQLTEGTKYEPYARAAGAVAGSLAATPKPSRYGRGVSRVDDDVRKGADYLASKGVRPTAGQVADNQTLMKMEGALSATDDQLEQFTRAALAQAGNKLAKRATPEVLNRTQKTITRGMNEVLDIDAPIPNNIGARVVGVAEDYFGGTAGRDLPVSLRKISETLEDAATSPGINTIVPAKRLREWRSILGKYTTSNNEATREASHALREVIDDITENALRGLGREGDIAKLAGLREQYRNFLAISDAASKTGRDAARGLLSPNSLNTSMKKIVGKTNASMGKGTDLANLTRKAEANIGPVATVSPGGIRDILNSSTAAAGYGMGGAGLASLAGLSTPAALGVGAGAALLPGAMRGVARSGAAQSLMMDPRNLAVPFAGSGPGLLNSMLPEQEGR